MLAGDELAKVVGFYGFGSVYDEKIICPIHDDINPSMRLDYDSGSFYCFGCGCSGDALKLAILVEKKYNNLDELHACIKYVQILKAKSVEHIHIGNRNKKYVVSNDLLDLAADDYFGLSKTDWVTNCSDVKKYMLERGFFPRTLNAVKAKENVCSKNYPIIFPIVDNGKFKGWVCRTDNEEVAKKRKYLYNEGFSRATTVVGYYGRKPYVFVVEGYMDRLKFLQFGEQNVVALFGWKITAMQIASLKKAGIVTVISALDNDLCGRKGTKELARHFDMIRFSFPQGIKDPGEMTKKQFWLARKKIKFGGQNK